MHARLRPFLLIVGFGLTAGAGYWLATTAAPKPDTEARADDAGKVRAAASLPESTPVYRTGERKARFRSDDEALDAGALPGQRALVFKDQAALEAFLARAGDRIRIMGRLDALNALRVGFLDYAELAELLDGSEESSMIFPVYLPDPQVGGVQPGAIALGNGLLEWLGIEGDNSGWGAGVRIAVLDTGVSDHSAFTTGISSINLIDLPENPADWNGHGTAVASLIIGDDPRVPGVVPGAEMISVRVANDSGRSDSFVLAQGILAAMDAGAQVINISLGSHGDSVLVRNAIERAQAAGAVIVASTGNEGAGRVAYPAANNGVIAVGAVDAAGAHLQFSNSGNVTAAAPGYALNAAWPGDQAVSFTGTSGSSPVVAAAVAAVMYHTGFSAQRSADLLMANLNDGGAPGHDPQLGGGMIDVSRAIAAGTGARGIYDAAVASNWVVPATETNPYPQLQVVVQNRGTETLSNSSLQVDIGSGPRFHNVPSLRPNAIQTINVPLPAGSLESGRPLNFTSTITLNGPYPDVKTSNNRRIDTYAPSGGQ